MARWHPWVFPRSPRLLGDAGAAGSLPISCVPSRQSSNRLILHESHPPMAESKSPVETVPWRERLLFHDLGRKETAIWKASTSTTFE
jgi:hypothetical protein